MINLYNNNNRRFTSGVLNVGNIEKKKAANIKLALHRKNFSDIVDPEKLVPMFELPLTGDPYHNGISDLIKKILASIMADGDISYEERVEYGSQKHIRELTSSLQDDAAYIPGFVSLTCIRISDLYIREHIIYELKKMRAKIIRGEDIKQIEHILDTRSRVRQSNLKGEFDMHNIAMTSYDTFSNIMLDIFNNECWGKYHDGTEISSGRGVIKTNLPINKVAIITYVKKEFLEEFKFNYFFKRTIDPNHIVIYMDKGFDVVRSEHGSIRRHFRKSLFKQLKEHNVEIIKVDLNELLSKDLNIPTNLKARIEYNKSLVKIVSSALLITGTANTPIAALPDRILNG